MKKYSVFWFVILAIIISSCTDESRIDNLEVQEPTVLSHEEIVNHYMDVLVREYDSGFYLRPRLANEIKVFIHESVGPSDRLEIIRQFDKIEAYLNSFSFSVDYTDSLEDYTISIINGTVEYQNEVLGTNYNTDIPDRAGGQANGQGLDPLTCYLRTKVDIWFYNGYEYIVIHEILHAMGFGHSTDPYNVMYPTDTGLSGGIKEIDYQTLKLLYYDGVYGNVLEGCEDKGFYLSDLELEEVKERLYLILENDFR